MHSYVKDYQREAFQQHVLEEISAGGPVRSFWMRKPNRSSAYAIGLSFTPWGICIGGDISIGPLPHGIVSAPGYDLDWFTHKLSEDYLCSKFFGGYREWCRDDCLRSMIGSLEADLEDGSESVEISGVLEDLKDALENATWEFQTDQMLLEYLHDHSLYYDDGIPGYDYPQGDAGWLCVIQQSFRELYLSSGVTVDASQG